MVKTQRINPLARAIAVMSAVVIVSGGVTYAALAGEAKLTGNTISAISSNTPDLTVNNKQDANFNQTEEGFSFTNLTPGQYSEARSFQLKNSANEPLDIYAQITGEAPLPAGVTGNDIMFWFKTENGTVIEKTWQDLIYTPTDLLVDELAAGETENMKVRVKIAESVTVETINISNFDFTFTGQID